jgi:hypothetical protein
LKDGTYKKLMGQSYSQINVNVQERHQA